MKRNYIEPELEWIKVVFSKQVMASAEGGEPDLGGDGRQDGDIE